MRCRACNAMMAVQYTRRGGLEDLCSRCRTYVYYDLMMKEESDSQVMDVMDIETEIDETMVFDRNHETLGFLDETE